MPVQLVMPSGVISIAAMLINWSVILFFVFRQFGRLEHKPAIWKVFFVTIAGLFSFSIDFAMFGMMVKLSLLPIGVWIVYAFLKNRSWGTYRIFAWIGFGANFLFLVTTLLSGFLHNTVYPKDEVATYVADVSQADIVRIHPSAAFAAFDKEVFETSLQHGFNDTILGLDWHYESKVEGQSMYQKERFPYALTGVKARWGSGLVSSLYIQSDGKGLLVTNNAGHYYYRSERPLLVWETKE